MRTRLVITVAAVAVGALALSACASSKSKAPTGGGGSTTNSTAAPGVNAAAAALVPASIKSKGTLTIAMDASYPPDEFIGTNGKTIEGMDVDFGTALAAELGLKASFVNVTFDDIIPRLQSGQYDMGLSSFTEVTTRPWVSSG